MSIEGNTGFRRLDVKKLVPVLTHEPLWYKSGPVRELIDALFKDPTVEDDKEAKATKAELVQLVGRMLRGGLVNLGKRAEGFNDDDRWGGKFNPAEDKKSPDTVVVHHTATSGRASFDEIDALGLIRLYVPLYQADVFGRDLPVSSGHYLGDREIFVGYHDLIYQNGTRIKALKPDYTGFHAGSYSMNCRSFGISLVGNYQDKTPAPLSLAATKLAIAEYSPSQIIGHREVVVKDGQTVATLCPGDKYFGQTGWREEILP